MSAGEPHHEPPDEPELEQGKPEGTTHYWSVTRASVAAQVADETIRAWFDAGEIAGFRDGRGHRLIDPQSLRRRLNSVGVGEAAAEVHRHPNVVRSWFDQGLISGWRTASGRRRIDRDSIRAYVTGGSSVNDRQVIQVVDSDDAQP